MTATLSQPNNDQAATSATSTGAVECLCPFCGAFNTTVGRPCRHCGTEDTTAARAAARKRVGPWFVLQSKNPAAPGMTLPALLAQIRQGSVTEQSVIRGPATGQLWRLAVKVRGISREFGSCYGCGGELYPADPTCPHCQRPQSLPADIDVAPADVSPAVVERPEPPVRSVPRQDLLTPREVAKAFSLGFGPAAGDLNGLTITTPVPLSELLPANAPAPHRPRPTAWASAIAVVTVVLLGWVGVHSFGGRHPEPAAAVEVAPQPPVVAQAVPARPAPVLPPAPAEEAPVVRPAVLVHRIVPLIPAPAVAEAIPANEPTPTDGSVDADDPKRLMAAGLAAEARGDYAGAVKQYERIESLSSDEWPAGLKDRLSLARSAARGE